MASAILSIFSSSSKLFSLAASLKLASSPAACCLQFSRGYKIICNDLRPGSVFERKGKLYRVIKAQHLKMGRGGGFIQAEIKDLKSGAKTNEKYRAAEEVEHVEFDREELVYVEKRGESFIFSRNTESDSESDSDGEESSSEDEIAVNPRVLADTGSFLVPGMEVVAESHEGELISIRLPEFVTVEVLETEPGLKSQSEKTVYKQAVVTGGLKTTIPPFVEKGESIVVYTENGAYFKRAE